MASIISACALCGNQRPIRDSHIIPEFCYKPLYQKGKHRFHVLTNDEAANHRDFEQKGYRAPLLCDDCERLFNDSYEKPFREIWFDRPLLPNPVPKLTILTVPDFSAFKLFHLSVLWRAGVAASRDANDGFWKTVFLGRHEARIRRMLLAKDPGPAELYPLMAWAIVDPVDQGSMQPDIIVPPIDTKMGSMHAFWFIYGGCSWLYAVSSHYDSSVSNLHLQANGSIPIIRCPYTQVDHLMQIAAQGIARTLGSHR